MAGKLNTAFSNLSWTKQLAANGKPFKGAIQTYDAILGGMSIDDEQSTIAVGFSVDKAFIFYDTSDGYLFGVDDLAMKGGVMSKLDRVNMWSECHVIAWATFDDDFSTVDVDFDDEAFSMFKDRFVDPNKAKADILKRLRATSLFGIKETVKM